jgi:hypothetical protein
VRDADRHGTDDEYAGNHGRHRTEALILGSAH